MSFHFTHLAPEPGIFVIGQRRRRAFARWQYCAEAGRLVRRWQHGLASAAPEPARAGKGADDLLNALLRRHRELRAA